MNSSDWSAHTWDILSQNKEYTQIFLKYTFFFDHGSPAFFLSAKRSKNVEDENGERFYQQEHQICTAPMEVGCINYPCLQRSKRGFENILVLTDHYTRYAQAKALYETFLVHYGFPARIHGDQGAYFESKLSQSLCS